VHLRHGFIWDITVHGEFSEIGVFVERVRSSQKNM